MFICLFSSNFLYKLEYAFMANNFWYLSLSQQVKYTKIFIKKIKINNDYNIEKPIKMFEEVRLVHHWTPY